MSIAGTQSNVKTQLLAYIILGSGTSLNDVRRSIASARALLFISICSLHAFHQSMSILSAPFAPLAALFSAALAIMLLKSEPHRAPAFVSWASWKKRGVDPCEASGRSVAIVRRAERCISASFSTSCLTAPSFSLVLRSASNGVAAASRPAKGRRER